MARVSIVVRTHNEEEWIGQCLRKVSEQTIDDVEVILVDNKSTDKTVAKARNVRPDLTILEIEDYLPGLALNMGFEEADSDFVVCLSAHCVPVDDYWLESLLDNFEGSDNIAGVYGRQVPVESSDPVDKRDLIRTFGLERRVQEQDTFFHNANSMVRRSVWEDHPFKEDVTNIEDQIWGNEVINADYRLVYEPDAAVYHHHGINQGNDQRRTKSVVRTMENHQIQPDDTLPDTLQGNPLDPEELDIIAFVPIRRRTDTGVDFNESLITRTIESAAESQYIDDVFVSTDSEQVAEKAEEWGAKAPFVRPEELSAADVSVVEVFQYSLEQIEDSGRYPDLVATMEITHPFRPPGMLDKLVEELLRGGYDSVAASFPEYRPSWILGKGGEFQRVNQDTQFRSEREPVQIGLVSLGCVTYPKQIREGRRIGDDIGFLEVTDPIATVEIRQREDLKHWEKLSDLDGLNS